MAQQFLQIVELEGLNRNRAPGLRIRSIFGTSIRYSMPPTWLFNLGPDRQGAYRAFGRTAQVDGVTLPFSNMIGYDQSGISSYNVAGALKLFRDATLSAQGSPAFADVAFAAHMARAGGYISRDQFMVLNRAFDVVEPMTFSSGIDTSTFDTGGVDVDAARGTLIGVAYGNGKYMAVNTAGGTYLSSDGVNWTATPTSPGGATWDIAYGSGTWVVVGDGGNIFYSTDDGATWTGATPASTDNLYGVNYDALSGFFTASGDDWIRSVDSGVTWTLLHNLDGVGQVREVACSQASGVWAGTADAHTVSYAGAVGSVQTPDSGATINMRPDGTWESGGTGAGVECMAADTTGIFAGATTSDGTVWASTDGRDWTVMARIGVGIRGIMFDSVSGAWIACGDTGKVYQSKTLASWTPYSDFGGATTTNRLYDIATDGAGQIVVVGNGGTIVVTKSAQGLPSGAYTAHVIAYFNTEAGKFVFAYDQHDVNFSASAGNVITLKVSGSEKLKADTAGWTIPVSVLADIKIDVYLNYTSDQSADTSQPNSSFTQVATPSVTRYAFTKALPGGATLVKLGDDIKDLPLGQALGGDQGMTTMVMSAQKTALHQGRLFGMMSQDEARWPADGTSKEIANQFGDFILGYSETNWANFMRPDNYLILRPTKSTQFTGMISTPSGLMVMFDSEIMVINGDPDLGGFTVDQFPDVVGNDSGVTPTNLGGVAIVAWGGQLYALQGGKAVPLSQDVFLATDPFISVVAEPQRRCLLAVSQSGRTFRYFFEYQFWMDDPTTDLVGLLPNCACNADDYTRGVTAAGAAYSTRTDGTPDTPYLQWDAVDFGVGVLKGGAAEMIAGRRHALYRARFLIPSDQGVSPASGITSVVTDRTDGLYSATAVPRLYYQYTSRQSDVNNPASTDYVLGQLSEERLAFHLPKGMKSRLTNLKLELRSMDYTDVFRPPMEWFYSMTDRAG